ncbi:MAG: E3 binding domain-containing protein, partial [Phaeodactylibacter sp.]|nr:E3 binding domain-containing protein [Phaeodactylibacter sp.]
MSVVEMKVPTIGESITEVTLSQWLKKDGDYVELDEPICEFESDKATLEFPAEAAGKLIHVAAEGDDLEIGALVAKVDTSVTREEGGSSNGAPEKKEEKKKEEQPAPAPAGEESKAEESYATGHPSPAAGKILKEADIQPEKVEGTGRGGRITKEDALKAVEAQKSQPSRPEPEKEAPQKTQKQIVSTPRENFSRDTSRKKMSRMRRTIAKRLVSAKNETAMLTTF